MRSLIMELDGIPCDGPLFNIVMVERMSLNEERNSVVEDELDVLCEAIPERLDAEV